MRPHRLAAAGEDAGTAAGTKRGAREQRQAIGIELTRFHRRARARAGRVERDNVNHAADRIGAIEVAEAAAHHFNPLDRRLRHAAPIHPAAKRIVQRHAAGQHQRARRARRRQAPHRHALRRRVGGAGGRTAKQGESRRFMTQRVVRFERGGAEQVGRRQERRGRGRIRTTQFAPAGGHGHLLCNRCGFEHDAQSRRPSGARTVRADADLRRRESRGDDHEAGGHRCPVDGKCPARIGGGDHRPGRAVLMDFGDDRRASGVDDETGDRRGRLPSLGALCAAATMTIAASNTV